MRSNNNNKTIEEEVFNPEEGVSNEHERNAKIYHIPVDAWGVYSEKVSKRPPIIERLSLPKDGISGEVHGDDR